MITRGLIVRLIVPILVITSVAAAAFVVTRSAPHASKSDCTASQMPAVPHYKQVVNPTTGLMPKRSNPDDYKAPPGMIPNSNELDAPDFKAFLKSCNTSFNVEDQTIIIDQQKYNYIIKAVGLNASYRNGIRLSSNAAESLGLPTYKYFSPRALPSGQETYPVNYMLVPKPSK